MFRELERKTYSVDWRNGDRRVWYVLFSTSGFSENLKEIAAERRDLLLLDEQKGEKWP